MQVVVHLIQLEFVFSDVLQEWFIELPLPVQEPAAGSSSSMHFPIANQGQSLVQHQDLIDLLHLEHSVLTQVQAMIHYCFSQGVITTRETIKDSRDQLLHREISLILFLH